MSEARDLFERFRDSLNEIHQDFAGAGKDALAFVFSGVLKAADDALADHPPPDAVSELPEWVTPLDKGWYRIRLKGGFVQMETDAIERIGDLRDLLAARRRAEG
jgi:hypothetical protein